MHRIEVATLDASDLGRYQGIPVLKRDRTLLSPVAKLAQVHLKCLTPLDSPIGWRRLKDCCDRESRVIMIVKQLDAAGARPEKCFCFCSRRHGGLGVARKECHL